MSISRNESPLIDAQSGAVGYHGSLAGGWEQRYQKRSFQARIGVLAECLNGHDLTGTTWVDAGCGSGTLSRWLAERGCNVLGFDAASGMVQQAAQLTAREKGRHRLRFEQVETILRLPLDSGSMDGVLCSSVLEYLPGPVDGLKEFARVLRAGGVLLVSVPNRLSLVRRAQVSAHHIGRALGRSWQEFIRYSINEYGAGEFARTLAACGFATEKVLVFGSPLPRWLQRRHLGGSLLMFAARKGI